MIPFSILDLSQIGEGGTASQALENSRLMARKAEELGYHRFWLAEHHGMRGIASAATAVVIGHVGAATSRIRVGAGGIMLPNHAPLVVAEQFGTLEALFPGRVDLGIGRAPGTDMVTARALRRNMDQQVENFPRDVLELQAFLGSPQEGQRIVAVPGMNSHVPIWLLGSSLYSAQLAAALGMPFAFASHFAPEMLMDALAIYREQFKPSAELDRPHAMVGLMGVGAATDAEARRLYTSLQQSFAAIRRGERIPFPRPVDDVTKVLAPAELAMVERTMRYAAVGGPETLRAKLAEFIAETAADEVIISMPIYDIEARLRSVEIFAGLEGLMERRG